MQSGRSRRTLRLNYKEIHTMKIKRLIVLSALILLVGMLAISLSACKLPASQGVATATSAGGSFPVPDSTNQNMGGIDVSAFSTQTAQAVIVPPDINPVTQVAPPAVTDTPPAAAPAGATPVPPTTAPGAAPTYVAANVSRPEDYVVQEGEWIYCLARRFDVNPYDLIAINGLNANGDIYPGLLLDIPQSGSYTGERTLLNHPTTYTVSAGDTIYTIACEFGDVAPESIAEQNDLSAPYTLNAGQVLTIP